MFLVTSFAFLLILPGSFCTLTEEEIDIFRTSGITVIDKDTNTWTIEHHGVPTHEHGGGGYGNNPNNVTVQNHSFDIPKVSTVAEDKGCVRLGPIGLSLSGAPFFNPYTINGNNAVDGECQETFDDCSGHPGPDGTYHYHKLPACLYTGDLPDKLLGVAFDGYPIYGPMDSEGNNLTTRDLDRCHGHTYNGRYIYRITHDFPYILGCYHGAVVDGNIQRGPQQDQQPPSGSRPPARQKRSVYTEELRRSKRQVRACSQNIDQSWMTETCYAFCENPGKGSFDNCVVQTDDDDTSSGMVFNAGFLTLLSAIMMLLLS